ncbi:putative membrane protein [Trichinella spiralis]|uniref:hypothetical protein n=1 Tax=Trichinella spiralis TaxID=6334 RepID=UPI0001EFC022|nr:putative membrane protein [Trichinella spiralis]
MTEFDVVCLIACLLAARNMQSQSSLTQPPSQDRPTPSLGLSSSCFERINNASFFLLVFEFFFTFTMLLFVVVVKKGCVIMNFIFEISLHLKIIHYAILRIKSSGNVKELARDYKLRKETKEEYWEISCQLQAVDGQTDSLIIFSIHEFELLVEYIYLLSDLFNMIYL